MSEPPAPLPPEVAPILDHLDQLAERLREQLDPLAGDPPPRPGLSRVVAAVDRLRESLRLQGDDGSYLLATTFDLPLLRTFVTTMGAYAEQPAWTYDVALDLADRIERSVVTETERLRESPYRRGDPEVERVRDAAEAATTHIRTERRLAERHPTSRTWPRRDSEAGPDDHPNELPAAVVPLLDRLDRSAAALVEIAADSAVAAETGVEPGIESGVETGAGVLDGESGDRPGLGRIKAAVDRLRAALRIRRPGERAYPVAEVFDLPVLRTLAAVVEDLLDRDEWDQRTALEVARQIESTIHDHTRRLLRYIENNPNRFAELEELDAAASTAYNNIVAERSLLQQRDQIQQIASDVQQAAGAVADSELAGAFNRYDEEQTRSANAFRVGAIGVLVGVLAFSVYTAIEVPASLGSALAHVGIGLSGLTAFGYLARESAQHRRVARWAAIMAVQLKTLGAFVADLSHEEREQLRAHFGRRVFSELPEGDGQQGAGQVPSVQAVVDILQALRPSS